MHDVAVLWAHCLIFGVECSGRRTQSVQRNEATAHLQVNEVSEGGAVDAWNKQQTQSGFLCNQVQGPAAPEGLCAPHSKFEVETHRTYQVSQAALKC